MYEPLETTVCELFFTEACVCEHVCLRSVQCLQPVQRERVTFYFKRKPTTRGVLDLESGKVTDLDPEPAPKRARKAKASSPGVKATCKMLAVSSANEFVMGTNSKSVKGIVSGWKLD